MLSQSEFANIVRKTPIVAVDLLIEKQDGKVMLGKRKNNPAKGYFFTFGGIVQKDELLACAIARVSINELNYELSMDVLTFNGVFECLFEENFLDNKQFSSHYIVLSYHFKDNATLITPPSVSDESGYSSQHSEYVYLYPEEILADSTMHKHLKLIVGHYYGKA